MHTIDISTAIIVAGLGIDSASLSISGDDSSSFLYAIRK